MSQIKPHTLSGFMELLPQPQLQMEAIMEVLRNTYSLYGFTPLDTPAIEAADVLLAKGGGETEKQIYRFQKGDSDLALRFDLTVPLAKYVALHYGELAFPFRRYQIGKVYRGERAQRGRFREFYQADIDIIGDGKLSITNEAEIPSIIYKTFSTLGLRRFQIRVNNRKILNGFYAMLGLSEQSGDIMRTVDKLDKIGSDKVRVLLVEECGVEEAKADEILTFTAIPVDRQDLVLIAPRNHPLAQKHTVDLEEALPYPQVYFSPGSGLRDVVDVLYQKIGQRPIIAYETEEDQVIAGLVAHGFGIAIVPEMELLSSLNVKVIEILHPIVKRNIYMISSNQFYMPPVVRNFHDFVLETVSQNL